MAEIWGGTGVQGAELLGNAVQICLVTRDHKRTIDQLLKLGIGPWRIQTLQPETLSETRYRDEPHSFRVIMAFASSANMVWEVVEPVDGTGVFHDFLEARGEGIHHVGFLCPGRSFTEAIEEFKNRGFYVIQSGRWLGKTGYAFIGTHNALGAYLEIWDHTPGFVHPEPDEWYPPLLVAKDDA